MDLGSIFLILALAVLVSFYISRPFFNRSSEDEPLIDRLSAREQDHVYSFLLAERDRLLTALQELDFDHTLGKIPESDYPAQRAALMQAGAVVLRKLDELAPEGTPVYSAEERLEAAVAVKRVGTSRRSMAQSGELDEIESMVIARRLKREEKMAGFCSQCGAPVRKSDQFCSRCGARIA